MPDEIDRLVEQNQTILDASIARARAAAAATKHEPFCRRCGEPIPPERPSNICIDCAEEAERMRRRRL